MKSNLRAPERTSEARSQTRGIGTIILKMIVIIIILGLAGASFYFYKQYNKIKNNPNIEAQENVKSTTDKISKIMELPEGETPVIATVSDREKLQEQSFFKKAENGDKILIYANAKKAILYRESTNRVIEVAPLLIDQKAAEKEEQEATQEDEETQDENDAEPATDADDQDE